MKSPQDGDFNNLECLILRRQLIVEGSKTMPGQIFISSFVLIFSLSLLGMRTFPQVPDSSKIKQESYLIIGSARKTGATAGPLVDAIYRHNMVDLSHMDTFGEKSTTMDLLTSEILNVNHIVGDARVFDFSKYIIRSVFIERLATVLEGKSTDASQEFANAQINYLGAVITNIAKNMPSGAVMEIEWLPYTGLYGFSPDELDMAIKKNPFHCFINHNVLLKAIFILGGDKENINTLNNELYLPTIKMMEQIYNILDFYHKNGVGKSFEDLLETIYWEARVIHQMMIKNKHIFFNYEAINQDHKLLSRAIINSFTGIFQPHLIGKKIIIRNISNQEMQGYVYDLKSFITKSFLNAVIQDIAAQHNLSEVYSYIRTLDFNGISIRRKQSPYNGRHNVWMIKMIKN